MRNTLIIGGICILAIAVGAVLYVRSINPTPSGQNQQAIANTGGEKNISFKAIDQGTHTASMTARKNLAIYDTADFSAFWKKVHGDDGTKPPIVDFSDNYVIGVFAGTEPSGGYHIAVSKITESGGARSVQVRIEQPGEHCTVIEEKTSPYQFVVVALSSAEALAHSDEIVTADCR